MAYDQTTTIANSKTRNIRKSDELLNWYFDDTKEILTFLWDENDEIIYCSEQVEKYFQLKPEELIGIKWTEIIEAQCVSQIKEHFSQSGKKLTLENVKLPSDYLNESHIFNGVIDLLFIEEKSYFICQLKNLTAVNELKDFLIETDQLITSSQLSAGIVHEIRNPLTSLKGFLQLVQSGITQKEEYYRVMIGEVEKLEKITADLLQMAKPDIKEKKSEQIHTLLEDVIFLIDVQMDMRNVEFDVNVEEDLLVHCNASQIKQVLLNLIKNGAEAMKHSGLIKVQACRNENKILIHIVDEGEGITSDQVRELNNPFYTTKESGTGLGLVIINHILSLHEGELKVKSNEKIGTTFTVILPYADDL